MARGSLDKVQGFATFTATQAAAVQNTWYTMLSIIGNIDFYQCSVRVDSASETLDARLTIDGTVYPLTGVVAVDGTRYAITFNRHAALESTSTDDPAIIKYGGALKCKTLLFEVRKTTNVGASSVTGRGAYSIL